MSGNTPLRFLGVGNMLDREYRNSPPYQWARELARNGIEAGATVIQFGPEWQGVENSGIYRLQYADDGHGMTREDLREYMLTLGKGGKVVGGPHDNYALGSRMTLLPWNPEGVVVISQVEGESPYMVKMKYDPDASHGEGEYVLEEIEWVEPDGTEGKATVYPPYEDDELDIDWLETIPEFILKAGHGTTFTLLGRNVSGHTINGDSDRNETLRYLTRKYFNIRIWDLPQGLTLRCFEMPEKPGDWPKAHDALGGAQNRSVRGARSIAEYLLRDGTDTLDAKGTVTLTDGTRAHWFLRKEDKVETGGVGSTSGFIAVLYRGELYGHAFANIEDGDTRIGANVYRQFGIGSDAVRRRVFLILEPPEYDEATGQAGVAPSTGRADLYWMGAGSGARSVKPADWSEEFAEKAMPKEIEDAINAAHESSRGSDEERMQRMKRVMDRFEKRWKAARARVADTGSDTTTRPSMPGTPPREPIDSPTPTRRPRRKTKRVVVGPRKGDNVIGLPGTGDVPAKRAMVSLGFPDVRWVTAEDINDDGMIAAWQQPSKQFPSGCIELDETHPVIKGQIEFWQAQYPRAVALQVEEIVREAYCDVAVAKVSHMFALTGTVLSEEARDLMLLNPALTTSLLGLIGEDALISPRMGKVGTKRKRPDDDVDNLDEAAS